MRWAVSLVVALTCSPALADGPVPAWARKSPAERVAAPPAPTPAASNPTPRVRTGRCDCPDDLDSLGRRCGGRSAYIRPNGRAPECDGRL